MLLALCRGHLRPPDIKSAFTFPDIAPQEFPKNGRWCKALQCPSTTAIGFAPSSRARDIRECVFTSSIIRRSLIAMDYTELLPAIFRTMPSALLFFAAPCWKAQRSLVFPIFFIATTGNRDYF